MHMLPIKKVAKSAIDFYTFTLSEDYSKLTMIT